MPFDVAVWEGPGPADEADAQAQFARRCEAAYARADAGLSPAKATPRLRAFITDVRRYFPDGDRDLDGVWARGRLFEGWTGTSCTPP